MKTVAQTFQKDLMKKHRKSLWSKFIKGIQQFNLVEDGDKILVAVSGGKDSLLLAKMMDELTKHPIASFDVVLVTMDPGYAPDHLATVKQNMEMLGLKVIIEPYNIFKVVDKMSREYPCYLCARMRRGFLYSVAEKYGCNKLALGHHYDDVIETTLLNIFFSGTFKTMLPKIPSENYEGIELIRPMYFIREESIKRLMRDYDTLRPLDCACTVAAGHTASRREDVKQLIKQLKADYPGIDKRIFRAAANVNLNHVLQWEKDGVKTRFDDKK